MLQAIRDKTSGWIAYLIVFLISIPFALWGVNSYLGGGEVAPAAIVDGQEISLSDLDNAYANYRRRLAQVFGGSIPEGFADESVLKDQVLSQLIEEFALRSYAERNHYRVSDQHLNEIIRSMEAFQTEGKFDAEIYQRQVSSLGYSPAGFEFELRQTQAMEQLQVGISATAFTVPNTSQKLRELSSQARTIRIVTSPINSENFSVSDEEISEYFQSNASRFLTEEQVKIDYIELSLEGIKSAIEVSEEQVRDRYEQSRQAYTSTEVRTASHILLTLTSDASEGDSKEAEDQLLVLREQLNAGADFAELAKLHSQDPVSATEGGDLGEVERGMMVQPFEKTLFELGEGEVSQPIKTSFGWHLIKLHQVSGGEVKSFDEVRQVLSDEIKTEIAEGQIYDLNENLSNLAYEQTDSLLPAAEQLGLVLQISGWFGRSQGDGIAGEPKVRTAAFSSDILVRGLNSEAIELTDNRIVFLRVNEHKPAVSKQLDEVREQIVSEVKLRKAREENIEKGKKALEQVVSGEGIETIASDWQASIVEPGSIKRDNRDVNAELVKLAFSMSKPTNSPVYEGFAHANGDYSLVELISVESSGDTPVQDNQETLTSAVANQEYQSILKLLGVQADVTRTSASELVQ